MWACVRLNTMNLDKQYAKGPRLENNTSNEQQKIK